MAIDSVQLIYPNGRIHPDMFPDRSETELDEDIQAWVADGYADARVVALETDAEKDAAAKAWAYYRAFDAAAIALSANPTASTQSDAGAASYAKDQRDHFRRLAAEALAEFNEMAPKVAANRYTGLTVTHDFAW